MSFGAGMIESSQTGFGGSLDIRGPQPLYLPSYTDSQQPRYGLPSYSNSGLGPRTFVSEMVGWENAKREAELHAFKIVETKPQPFFRGHDKIIDFRPVVNNTFTPVEVHVPGTIRPMQVTSTRADLNEQALRVRNKELNFSDIESRRIFNAPAIQNRSVTVPVGTFQIREDAIERPETLLTRAYQAGQNIDTFYSPASKRQVNMVDDRLSYALPGSGKMLERNVRETHSRPVGSARVVAESMPLMTPHAPPVPHVIPQNGQRTLKLPVELNGNGAHPAETFRGINFTNDIMTRHVNPVIPIPKRLFQ